MAKTHQVDRKTTASAKNSKVARETKSGSQAKGEKDIPQQDKKVQKTVAIKNTQRDWRILTVILKLMHFAIYASFYLTKIMCEKFNLLAKNMHLIISALMGWRHTDDFEQFDNFMSVN